MSLTFFTERNPANYFNSRLTLKRTEDSPQVVLVRAVLGLQFCAHIVQILNLIAHGLYEELAGIGNVTNESIQPITGVWHIPR